MDGVWLAALSGVLGGGTLLVGAAIAWFVNIPQRVIAAVMAVGSGVLVATLAFELVGEAADTGGTLATGTGFIAGAILYVVADWFVSRPHRAGPGDPNIAARRGRSRAGTARGPDGSQDETQSDVNRDPGTGSGAAIAAGALIDGIPESIVMGLAVLQGGALSIPVVVAVAISNIPEGLGSTAAMRRQGSKAVRPFAIFGAIAIASVIAAVAGYLLFADAPPELIALITTVAAGALFAMVANTVIPEAFSTQHFMTGIWASIGFVSAFVLHQVA